MAADRDGQWRGDAANRNGGGSFRSESSDDAGMGRRWVDRLIHWAEYRFPSAFRNSAAPANEEVFHDFVQEIAEAADGRAVGSVLTLAARRLTGASEVELIRRAEGRSRSGVEAAIEIRGGDGVRGWLAVRARAPLSAIVRRRLETLGAVAAAAFDRLDDSARGDRGGSLSSDETREAARRDDASNRAIEDTDLGIYPSAPAVHDATFLNAVFPFALSQARRHGESLTVLCAAVDRLNGIRDVLGPDQVDRTVRQTGTKIATLIRSSDIVARLDDDRLMVLLPRAELAAGLIVARKLCQGVADNAGLLSDAPVLTLSIGVASYPECAADLYELLDAADSALSDAQNQGRNGVATAPTLAVERDARRSPCAV